MRGCVDDKRWALEVKVCDNEKRIEELAEDTDDEYKGLSSRLKGIEEMLGDRGEWEGDMEEAIKTLEEKLSHIPLEIVAHRQAIEALEEKDDPNGKCYLEVQYLRKRLEALEEKLDYMQNWHGEEPDPKEKPPKPTRYKCSACEDVEDGAGGSCEIVVGGDAPGAPPDCPYGAESDWEEV